MSAIITGRVFWTPLNKLSYTNEKGKPIRVAEATGKVVLLAIADNSDDYGENSWQSADTIATKTGIQRRSVIRVVKALITGGYVAIEGVTKYGTNNYKVITTKLGNAPIKRAAAAVGRPKIGDSSAKIGDSGADIGDSESPDPSINHPNPPKRGKKTTGVSDIPELVLYREVVRHWPQEFQRDSVVEAIQKVGARLGRPAVAEDLIPWWKEWGTVSGNEWSLVWLVEWAVQGKRSNTKNGQSKQETKELEGEALERALQQANSLMEDLQ